MVVIRYILSVAVILNYALASVGFTLHTCSSMNTVDVLFLTSDLSCNHIHKGCSCGSGHCHKNNHDKHCCTNDVHQLEDEYNSSDSVVTPQATTTLIPYEMFAYIPVMERYRSGDGNSMLISAHFREYSPPEDFPDFYKYFSVWRL